MTVDLRRLVRRHRHVAPMLSALLGGTQAALRITDAAGTTILERDVGRIASGAERFPILVEGQTLGWVEGDRIARVVAAVLSYAAAREADKRSLANEALDRYRELNLVYDLAERLNVEAEPAGIVSIAEDEAARLVHRGVGRLRDTTAAGGILGAVAASGTAEIVTDIAADPRASADEREFAALAAAPVTANGRPLGVLGALGDGTHHLTSADLKLLTAIALLVGPALERARASTHTAPSLAGDR